MRKLAALSSVLVLGALGASLTGCPVWENNPNRPVDDAGPDPDVSCTADSQCPGGYCNVQAGQCVTSPTCGGGLSCSASYYCDSRGVCVPGCSSDTECSRLGTGLVCDTTTHRCGPSGRCTTDTQCSGATPVCLNGSCQPRTSQCQFDYQCAAGHSCVDGSCIAACTPTDTSRCATGQVCTSGRCTYPTGTDCGGRCTSGQLCVEGVCLQTCSTDEACGTGQMCDHGVCRADTRPHPICTLDSQCNTGSVCYNGACRRTCPTPMSGTDGGCMMVDSQFDLCRMIDTRYLCTSTQEQMPQCARSADCTAGRACVNGRCL